MDKWNEIYEAYTNLRAKYLPDADEVKELEILKKDAQSAKLDDLALFFEAHVKIIQKDFAGALPLLESAIKLTPDFANAYVTKGYVLDELGRHEEEIKVYDDAVLRFGSRTDVASQAHVAQALVNKGYALGEMHKNKEEIKVYDDLVSHFGKRTELPLLEQVAKALVNKGITLGEMHKNKEEIKVYDDLVSHFGKRTELPLLEQVAKALLNKSLALGDIGKNEEAIKVCDDVVARFGTRTEPPVLDHVAKALVNKGWTLGRIGKNEEAIIVCSDVVARFGKRTELPLLEQVAGALVNKGWTLGRMGQNEAAIKVCDDVVARFGARPEVPLLEQVARALVYKGLALGRMGQYAEEIQAYDDLVARSAKRTEPEFKLLVAQAQVQKSRALESLGKRDKARQSLKNATQSLPKGDEEYLRSIKEVYLDPILKEFSEEKDRYFASMDSRKQRSDRFLVDKPSFNADSSFLLVLREWNSFTPTIPDEYETDRGGGYFLWHKGTGIVIDPGYDFIENFHRAGGRIHDIHHIVLTHAHADHTAEVESLLTLLHEYNHPDKPRDASKSVNLYMSQSAQRKFSGIIPLKGCDYVDRIVTMNSGDKESPQSIRIAADVSLTVLPAYHDDIISGAYAVGLGFELRCSRETRRVLFTGDTCLYPADSEDASPPRIVFPEKGKAVYEQYPKGFTGKDNVDLVVAHIGSILKDEFPERESSDDSRRKPAFYANHLGLLGTIILLNELSPKAAILSEFGEELKDIRNALVERIDTVLRQIKPDREGRRVVPGDVTIVYDIESGKFLCHDDCQFRAITEVEPVEVDDPDPRIRDRKPPKRTFLFGAGSTASPRILSKYYAKLELRELPYFAKE